MLVVDLLRGRLLWLHLNTSTNQIKSRGVIRITFWGHWFVLSIRTKGSEMTVQTPVQLYRHLLRNIRKLPKDVQDYYKHFARQVNEAWHSRHWLNELRCMIMQALVKNVGLFYFQFRLISTRWWVWKVCFGCCCMAMGFVLLTWLVASAECIFSVTGVSPTV